MRAALLIVTAVLALGCAKKAEPTVKNFKEAKEITDFVKKGQSMDEVEEKFGIPTTKVSMGAPTADVMWVYDVPTGAASPKDRIQIFFLKEKVTEVVTIPFQTAPQGPSRG